MNYLLVGGGAMLGGVSRCALGQLWPSSGFPWTTLLINLTGSFLLGLLLTVNQPALPASYRLLLGTGLLGAYTTFSTFSYETVALVQQHSYLTAASYVVASLLLCLASSLVGIRCGGLGRQQRPADPTDGGG